MNNDVPPIMENVVHLFMALFWFALGVVFQIYWDTLERHRFIPVSRHMVSFFFFVLFSYNFIRWRMERVRRQAHEEMLEPPPRPRHADPEYYDPTFDFSESKPRDEKKDGPPPV